MLPVPGPEKDRFQEVIQVFKEIDEVFKADDKHEAEIKASQDREMRRKAGQLTPEEMEEDARKPVFHLKLNGKAHSIDFESKLGKKLVEIFGRDGSRTGHMEVEEGYGGGKDSILIAGKEGLLSVPLGQLGLSPEELREWKEDK